MLCRNQQWRRETVGYTLSTWEGSNLGPSSGLPPQGVRSFLKGAPNLIHKIMKNHAEVLMWISCSNMMLQIHRTGQNNILCYHCTGLRITLPTPTQLRCIRFRWWIPQTGKVRLLLIYIIINFHRSCGRWLPLHFHLMKPGLILSSCHPHQGSRRSSAVQQTWACNVLQLTVEG